MKKLCAISTTETTLESFVIPAMRLFVERGYDVTLICTMSDRFRERYGKEFHLVDVKMKRGISLKDMLSKPFVFYKIFKQAKFDYVQYATTNAGWYASMGAWMARVPVRVYCMWGLLYTASIGIKRKILWLAEKVPCLFSTHYTCASYKNMAIAVSDGLCPKERVTVIGDGGTIGIDLGEFDIKQRETFKKTILSHYPQLNGKIVYGFLGRIDVDKGVNELLEAFMNLDVSNKALLMIGPFDNVRSGLDGALIHKAQDDSNVIFTGFTHDVAKYLSAVDIIVHPTYREGFSMVLQQAMAMGVAVITTDVPGPSEVIEENISGLLVPVKNSDALGTAMKRLADDVALRESFVCAGLMRVREKFERAHMLELTYKDRLQMMDYNNAR